MESLRLVWVVIVVVEKYCEEVDVVFWSVWNEECNMVVVILG